MAGIYIHIPFCKSRCAYCDFFSTTQLEKQQAYTEALLHEWTDRQHEIRETIRTIYFGGGTPSTLTPNMLKPLLEAFGRHDEVQEITLEANPGDITPEKARMWLAMGINRLSIGIQSFDNELLKVIGRRHTAKQARDAVAIAQDAGFTNISIDLIYALPGQTLDQWQQDVVTALQLGVQHISTYGLIYEEGTRMHTMLKAGIISAVDEELEIQMYDYLVEALSSHGFTHYEVSNFALQGYESKHNSSYWTHTPYIGLGAGAHSFDGQTRSWNSANLDIYIQQAMGHHLQPESESLDQEALRVERIMLGLRTNQGVAKDIVNQSMAQYYVQQGLLTEKGQHYIATTNGFHILNRIIEDLIEQAI